MKRFFRKKWGFLGGKFGGEEKWGFLTDRVGIFSQDLVVILIFKTKQTKTLTPLP